MRVVKIFLMVLLFLNLGLAKEKTMSVYDFSVKNIDGEDVSLSKYKDKVLLIVNVASKCGFTKQYEGLEKLFEKYKDKDFMILGFPSNQFAGQEPGTNEEIKEFCQLTFGVKFDMFAKVDVNGEDAIELYKYLKSSVPGILGTEAIKWNFTKFLIDKNGKVLKRYGSSTKPSEIEDDIKGLL